jgi:phage repressor protein C with HTH and peptisase S24 domain
MTIRDGHRTYSGEAVRAEWRFPPAFVQQELKASLAYLDIVEVRGDSMTNLEMHAHLGPGDRVVIDRRDTAIRQGGIFAVRDGDETIIKQVEFVRDSDPPRIICTSLNPRYRPFELVLDGSAEVIGRAIMKLARM